VTKQHVEWLTAIKQQMYPFIVACGSFKNFSHVYIVFKEEKYSFPSLIFAVNALCKCLYALKSRPIALENIFYFINKVIYKLEVDKKNLTSVSTLIKDIGL